MGQVEDIRLASRPIVLQPQALHRQPRQRNRSLCPDRLTVVKDVQPILVEHAKPGAEPKPPSEHPYS